MAFVHLHVHSHYSLLNGLTKIKPLVKAVKKRGFKSVALTDIGVMYGAIEFYNACKAEGVKPIIGFEAFVTTGAMETHNNDEKVYSLVLLAENYDGYRNLMLLCSEGQTRGLYNGKPRIDKETLKKYSQNIIALSSNIRGEVPSLILDHKIAEAEQVSREYNEIFGQDNFYLELQDHPGIEGQFKVNNELIEMSHRTNIPMVVTRDVYYLNPEDAEAQDILTCISKGWKVGQTDRDDYRSVDRSLNIEDDITSRFRHIEEALHNTGKIADRINIEIELDNWHFAPVDKLDGKSYDEMLRDDTYASVTKFYPEFTAELKERIDYELGIIEAKGYAPYFLCVADFVKYAKDNGIVESTRGSAAGSLVSYALGITTVDPIMFKLPFERFLNPYRPSPPDIDTDFADDRRDDMIEYVTNKYGRDKVAQIITFGTMAARASIRDVGRALGLSYGFCDQVAKLVPQGAQGFPMTIDRAVVEEPDLKKLYSTNEDVKRLLDLARKVEGCARHTSIHAAGVVISPTPLTDFCPVQYETGGSRLITQYEMKTVEMAGLLKNDFLGIRNLAILGNAVDIVEKTTGNKIDIYSLPLDDDKVFEMLSRGETMGVFQLSSSGMTRWIKELKPTNIYDINAMVALYRPGPMESIPEYIRRKYDPSAIKYFDPRLKDILEASFGLLVYQDDVMLTAIELAGYDWMEADKFRKAMGKKIPEEMAQQKDKFYKGCRQYGKISNDIIDEMWRAIEPFAAYGFNKAHAASYGMVAYQTAWMKAHYPVQFMTAILRAEFGDAEKVSAIVSECGRMGIEVLPPDVNESFKNFAMVSSDGEKGRIRFGLTAIKNVGDHICEVIYRERKRNGQYTSLEDFLRRLSSDKDLNKRSLDSLIKAGAMDCFLIDRGVLLFNLDNILQFVRMLKEVSVSNQNSLFAGTDIAIDNKVNLQDAPLATMNQKLDWEKNLLGLYVSSHPFTPYEPSFREFYTPLIDVENVERDSWVIVGGVVDKLMKKITKKGEVMMFATLSDVHNSLEMLVFPKTYEKTQSVWEIGKVICVVGKTPREAGDNKIFVENVYVLTPLTVDQVVQLVNLNSRGTSFLSEMKKVKQKRMIVIKVAKDSISGKSSELKKIISKYPGDYGVRLEVGGERIDMNNFISSDEEVINELKNLLVGAEIQIFN